LHLLFTLSISVVIIIAMNWLALRRLLHRSKYCVIVQIWIILKVETRLGFKRKTCFGIGVICYMDAGEFVRFVCGWNCGPMLGRRLWLYTSNSYFENCGSPCCH
jgi:hypothetical protein